MNRSRELLARRLVQYVLLLLVVAMIAGPVAWPVTAHAAEISSAPAPALKTSALAPPGQLSPPRVLHTAQAAHSLYFPYLPSKASAAPTYTYRIVNTYPHDVSAFTEGLVYDGGYLYEGTGLNGQSGIRKVDLTTGQVLLSQPLPSQYFGEGITTVGSKLYELTWTSHTGFVYDKSTFAQTGQFSYSTQGWGLTYDGQHLIMSDGTSVIHFLDPQTFAETSTIAVTDGGRPVTKLNELEYIGGVIYANVWLTDFIVMISPQTGQVLGWIDCTGLRPQQNMANQDAVLNGIAYDPQLGRLFVTGKLWPYMYQIQLVPKQ